MRTIDPADIGAPLPFEVDGRVPVAPAPVGAPAPVAAVQIYRRCHRDGLPLDAYGDCARCQEEKVRADERARTRLRVALVGAALALVAAVVLGFVWSRHAAAEERKTAAAITAKSGADVVVFTMTGCGACNLARAYLDARGVRYVERRIDTDPAAFTQLESLNDAKSVPTFVIDDEVMVGIDARGILLGQALARHGVPVTEPPQP